MNYFERVRYFNYKFLGQRAWGKGASFKQFSFPEKAGCFIAAVFVSALYRRG